MNWGPPRGHAKPPPTSFPAAPFRSTTQFPTPRQNSTHSPRHQRGKGWQPACAFLAVIPHEVVHSCGQTTRCWGMESPGCGLLKITKPELTVAHESHPSIPAIPEPLLRSRSGFPEFQPINDPKDIIIRRCPQGRNERRPQIQKPLRFSVPGE